MAYFIGLVENAGVFKNDKGENVDFHNFVFCYADEIRDEDKGRNEISTSKYRAQEFKIKADDVSRFFGMDVVSSEMFDNCFGLEMDLTFGRNGLSKARFKKPIPLPDIFKDKEKDTAAEAKKEKKE